MDDQKDLNTNENAEALIDNENVEAAASTPEDPASPDDPVVQATTSEEADETNKESPPVRRRWMRHPTKRVFGGVCGGLANCLALSEGLVRLFYLALVVVTGGVALLLYLLFWLFLPQGSQEEGKTGDATIELQARHGRWFAYGLIGLGVLLFAGQIGMVAFMIDLAGVILLPGILILTGFLILRKFHRKHIRQDFQQAKEEARRIGATTSRWTNKAGKTSLGLYRSLDDKVLAGVCGGIGKSLGVDPLLIRLAFVILSFVTALVGMIIVYALLAWLMPLENSQNGSTSGSAAVTG